MYNFSSGKILSEWVCLQAKLIQVEEALMLITNNVTVAIVITLPGAVFTSEGCRRQHSNSKQNTNNNCSNNQDNILHDDTDVATKSQLPTPLRTRIVTSIVVIRCL
jgi:hypothetical protein